jgi:hypothetical protein
MQRALEIAGISISQIVVSEKNENNTCGGYKLVSLEDADNLDENCGLILCAAESAHNAMFQALQGKGIKEENCLKMNFDMYEALMVYVSDRG